MVEQINKHTPLPWEGKPHIMDDSHSCNCTSWGDGGYMGGLLSVEVSNGIAMVSEGGNDAPPFEEAKANAVFVDKAIHSFYPMLEALEKLARLGNGQYYGNSDGNMIARDVLAKINAA